MCRPKHCQDGSKTIGCGVKKNLLTENGVIYILRLCLMAGYQVSLMPISQAGCEKRGLRR